MGTVASMRRGRTNPASIAIKTARARELAGRAVRIGIDSARSVGAKIITNPRERLRRWKQEKRSIVMEELMEEFKRPRKRSSAELEDMRGEIMKAIIEGEISSWKHFAEVLKENGIDRNKYTDLFSSTERKLIWQFFNPMRLTFLRRAPSI